MLSIIRSKYITVNTIVSIYQQIKFILLRKKTILKPKMFNSTKRINKLRSASNLIVPDTIILTIFKHNHSKFIPNILVQQVNTITVRPYLYVFIRIIRSIVLMVKTMLIKTFHSTSVVYFVERNICRPTSFFESVRLGIVIYSSLSQGGIL